jgi:glycerol-1-phosphate dehydrogenase [NAD(P)+]
MQKTSSCWIDRILIENDAINKLPEMLREFQFKKALVIADLHTV